MSRKSKGSNAERELIHLFWSIGWAAIRVAGSGSSRYPSPDIVASNKLRRLAIECKASKDKSKYIGKDEVKQLLDFASIFGAEPWIGVRFDNEDWFFLNPEDLKETNSNFLASFELAKDKGLRFEQITEKSGFKC